MEQFFKACREGDINYIEKIMKNITLNPDIYGGYGLSWACISGHLNIVKFFISKGANVGINNNLALTETCSKGHLDIVKLLVLHGAHIQARNNQAIINACSNGNLELVKFLIEHTHGADPNAQNGWPILYAAAKGHIEVVKYLVSQGVNPITKQADNNDVIIFASTQDHLNIVRYLLSVGCDWKKCSQKHKIILKTEQTQKKFRLDKFRKISKKLIPVYYSPDFTGGILAKKDLENFIHNLN